jgi:hypothetical protein
MRSRVLKGALFILLALPTIGFAQTFSATLNGAQEVPPVPTPATGEATLELLGDDTLSFVITYGGLLGTESAAHIHGPAPAGVNAGVQFPLPPGNPKVGVVGPLSAQQKSDLLDGLYYINIHTSVFPGGEIRGQIERAVPVENATWGGVKALFRVD